MSPRAAAVRVRSAAMVGLVSALVFAGTGGAARLGLIRHTVTGVPVSVSIPASWGAFSVPYPLTSAIVKQLVAKDAEASILANASFKSAGVRFIGHEPVQPGRFTANLNLIVQQLHPNETAAQWLFGASGVEPKSQGTTATAVIDGLRAVHFQSTTLEKAGSKPLFTDVYAFAHGGYVFDFTYTSLATDAQKYLPTFAASGASIRFAT